MQYLVHTFTKKKFIIIWNSDLTGNPIFLFANLAFLTGRALSRAALEMRGREESKNLQWQAGQPSASGSSEHRGRYQPLSSLCRGKSPGAPNLLRPKALKYEWILPLFWKSVGQFWLWQLEEMSDVLECVRESIVLHLTYFLSVLPNIHMSNYSYLP